MNAERTVDSGSNDKRGPAPLWALLVAGWVGAWIGYGPPLMVGPGWWVLLAALLVVLRLPLFFTALVALATWLIALISVPVTFGVGELLLDGPLAGPIAAVANAPVGALLGLERYTVTGGLALGLVLGTLCALVARGRWRHRTKRVPVRPTGIVVAVLLIAGLWFTRSSFATSILTEETESALAQLNGATADVTGVDLDLVESSLSIENVSLADPEELDQNIFEGLELTADVSTRDLLRKRVHIERVVVRRAASGSPREVPGVLIGDREPEPEPVPGSWDDYLQDFEVWKERLETAYEWIESMDEAEVPVEDLPLGERVADHILEPSPTVLISEFIVEGLSIASVGDETFSISGLNLSTNPALVDAPMEFRLNTNSEHFALGFTMPSASDQGRVLFSMRDVEVDALARMLRLEPGDGISGGTVDFELDGPWAGGVAGFIDLPLRVTLRDTQLSIGGSEPFALDQLVLPIQLDGRIDQPRVGFDEDLLIDALRDAGKAQLVSLVEERKQELLNEGKAQLEDELEELLGKDVDLGEDLSVDALKELAKDELDGLQGAAKDELRDKLQKEIGELQGTDGAGALDELEEQAKQDLEDAAKEKAEDLKKKGLEKLFGGG